MTHITQPIVVEHRVVVMTAGFHQNDPKLNPTSNQFSISVLSDLSSESAGA